MQEVYFQSYELSYQYKQREECRVIAFNKEQTIMVAGQECVIVIFDFDNGQLKLRQKVKINYAMDTLYFMKKDNQFIYGSYKEIGIYNYNDAKQQWYCQQLLEEAHQSYVIRVIMNKNEDLIISCGLDQTIKFWIKEINGNAIKH